MAKTIALAILHKGLARMHNEDNLYLIDTVAPAAHRADYEHAVVNAEDLQIYAIADGRGGPGIGDEAALTVLRIVDDQKCRQRPGLRLDFPVFAKEIVESGNRSICQLLVPYEGLPVGTTLSLLAIDRDVAYTLSLGNSRIWLFRDGTLRPLTKPHDNALPDWERLRRFRGLFGEELSPDEFSMTQTELRRGDVFLLATDGLSKMVDDDLIGDLLADPSAFIQQIRNLRTQALHRGGCDNLALIGIRIQEPLAVAAPLPGGKRRHRNVGGADVGSANRFRRFLEPLFFFLFFVLLGVLLGKIVFSLPVWLKILLR
ncbi:MAG: PP2C family protein-serine/threonine phosphatase [Saccharofermentanales bacterium]|jgi:serine/threonine protein phosphatase PrpC|nr:hypothetical protein [Clostridiaceae bacterium]